MDLNEIATRIRMHADEAEPVYKDSGFRNPIEIQEALKLIADALEGISKKLDR